MSGIEGKSRPKAYVSAVVTRKDGTVEDLGIIAETEVSNEEELRLLIPVKRRLPLLGAFRRLFGRERMKDNG